MMSSKFRRQRISLCATRIWRQATKKRRGGASGSLHRSFAERENERLAKVLKISLDKLGYFKEKDSFLAQLETDVPGIYLCGGATGPIDISESVVQATAASMKAVLRKSA